MPATISYDTDFSQIGIYNAVCTSYGGGMQTSGPSYDNSPPLLAAIKAALEGTGATWGDGGGIVLIPAGKYYCNSAITIDATGTGYADRGLIILGTGGSVELFCDFSGDFITLKNFNSGKGIRFKNLRITYDGHTAS